ncbi:actin [Tritrichomonas foetus]|uniref:Actin n=1 Tax=Tritrichomonas foetus TaxID=1144522 RepID=A0A1J4L2G0_9EUKA|nr:actin [Tritrichomonas foetus]|eukprot:OHT17602.1 actin [Tritrichomonas foetus]
MAQQTIVIDNGSGFTKVGFAGCEEPRSIFPSIIGTPNSTQLMVGGQNKDFFVGYEAVAKKDLLILRQPLDNGIVTNWDDIERIWYHCFYDELHIVPDDFNVLITEKPLNQRSHREKLMQVMFETFKVKSFYTGIQAVLALFSLGKTTGVVWDAGEGVSHTVSIYEGYGLPHAITRSTISGTDLTNYCQKLFLQAGAPKESLDAAAVSMLKETVCHVALDFQAAIQEDTKPVPVNLPDGTLIQAGLEHLRVPEVLFNPSLIDAKCVSIHQGIFNSIDNCQPDMRKELYANIILAGGTTMFHGLPERIEKEVVALAQPSMKVKVIATPGRKNSVWLGGSILASLEAFPQMCISQAEYREEGSQIVHRKCYC